MQSSNAKVQNFRVDWTDRLLGRGWPFAPSVALPPIDATLAAARKLAAGVADGVDRDGRNVIQTSRSRFADLLEAAAIQGLGQGIAHYAAIDRARNAIPARWKRGLFRLWCCITLAWAAFIVAMLLVHQPGRPEWGMVAAILVGPPLVLLATAAISIKMGIWVWNGFRGGP